MRGRTDTSLVAQPRAPSRVLTMWHHSFQPEGALTSLSEHRQRAILSALGSRWVRPAIVLLISIAKGIQADVSRQIDDLGSPALRAPCRFSGDSMFSPGFMGISRLSEDDVARRARRPGVRRAIPLTSSVPAVRLAKGGGRDFCGRRRQDWFKMRPWKFTPVGF